MIELFGQIDWQKVLEILKALGQVITDLGSIWNAIKKLLGKRKPEKAKHRVTY